LGALALAAACGDTDSVTPIVLEAGAEPGSAGVAGSGGASGPGRPAIFSDLPVAGLSDDDGVVFVEGDGLFDAVFREADGLGPLYTKQACSGCHSDGVRGPGFVRKMVAVEADGFTPKADQSALPYGNTAHPLTVGATGPVAPPEGDASIKITRRLGPPVVGRGFLEAIRDDEIERVAAEQAASGGPVKGRINRVTYQSDANADPRFHRLTKGDAVIGRFGLKARIGTLDDFSADAAQGDMGLTSPLRPREVPNPGGVSDDGKAGPDLSLEVVAKMSNYVRMLAIPRRGPLEARGAAIFEQVGCASCHVPSLKTRDDYPVAPIAGVDAPVYTDLLVHDMGEGLADGVREGEAGPRDWRTAPLVALRFNNTYLHDGRARTVEEAVLAHDGPGSEASESVGRWRALSAGDRALVLEFVEAL
jgi:CxxC motif-containing protein (DUF1111 family)